ncbi:MAG: hypothetical protein ACI4IV_05655, partial [Acutalibacteraceae bacterium]
RGRLIILPHLPHLVNPLFEILFKNSTKSEKIRRFTPPKTHFFCNIYGKNLSFEDSVAKRAPICYNV